MFGGLESKTFAYFFILWSLYFLLKGDHLRSVIFAAVATYWHFLAAGWYGLYLFLYMVIYLWKKDRKIILHWVTYGIIQIPLLVYLFTGLMENRETVIHGINTNQIYAYIRNPQHIGIFRSVDYFYHYHAPKVLMAVLALVIALWIFRKQTRGLTLAMNRLMVIILIQLLVFVPVAFFDRNGTLLKFYPFRGSVIAMMLFQLIIIIQLRDRWIPSLWQRAGRDFGRKKFFILQMISLLSVTLIVLGLKIDSRVSTYRRETPQWNDLKSLAGFLQHKTPPSATFLFLCREDEMSLALPRKSQRDSYYFHKYIPTTGRGIYEWYQRYQWKEKLMKDPDLLPEFESKHPTGYIVTCHELDAPYLRKVYGNQTYSLYRYMDDGKGEVRK